MKNYLIFLLCPLLFSCVQRGADEVKAFPDTSSVAAVANDSLLAGTPRSIDEVKKFYSQTAHKLRQGVLDSTGFEYDCSGERAGTVTYFSEQGELRMIRHSYSEYSHFSAVDQYFVSGNKLYFAHLTETTWSFESGKAAEGATKDDIKEKRLYVVGGKLALCLQKTYERRSHASDNPLPEQVKSREVDCKPSEKKLAGFDKLLALKDSTNVDCWE
ncbi:hypothetical protein [Pedobacter deserti]|uniref:hypothetical protein n=1 Tax=Pedobacter deserti TaxID=2817382 RepID=UPI00210C8133|nr:hypothetical protein [Pedobacter sp. SYSU D00382]